MAHRAPHLELTIPIIVHVVDVSDALVIRPQDVDYGTNGAFGGRCFGCTALMTMLTLEDIGGCL